MKPAVAPVRLIKDLYKYLSITPYRGEVKDRLQVTSLTSTDFKNDQMFVEGRRDSDIFHVLNCAAKSGLTEDYLLQTGIALARICTPPFPEREITAKVESVLKRVAHREGTIAEEVREYAMTSSDFFMSSECFKELGLTSRDFKKAGTLALLRMVKEGILVKHGNRRGCYRRVEDDLDIMDLTKASTAEFPLSLPLGVHEHAIIYPSNIVLVGGQKSAGKTAYLLNTVLLNKDRFTKDEILYLNSEMGVEEARIRCEKFKMTVEEWSGIFTLANRSDNYPDVIKPGRKLILIDFLEPPSEKLFLIKEMLSSIHQNLIKTGAVAVIAVQIHPDKEYILGKGFAREKPRLIVHLTYDHEKRLHTILIDEAKAWRGKNPRGMNRQYKLVDAHKYVPQGDWHD